MAAKVWFSDANATNWTESLACKAKDLFYEAGLNECITPGDTVAVKIPIGEWNRTRTLRTELVAAVVEEVKACGGKPFVTDTTTLPYHTFNSRVTGALELENAARHGFTESTLGCPVLIADGFSGDDDVRVEIPTGVVLKEAYVAAALAHADAMINVIHAKGHPITAYGGAIKAIGIGGQSKRGKFNEHLAQWGSPEDMVGWPASYPEKCLGPSCEFASYCIEGCHRGAISITEEEGFVRDNEKCRLCYSCQVTCLFTGHESQGFTPEYLALAGMAMADAALAVMQTFAPGKVGHLAYAIDTDPLCDCIPWATVPVCPDLGVFASKDTVAIDTCILDCLNAAPAIQGGANGALDAVEGGYKPGMDKYLITQGTSPRYQLNAGAKNGLGTTDYEMIVYKPPLTAEHAAKWQIRTTPTPQILKQMWEKRDYVKEVEPFQRVPFAERPNVADFDGPDRTEAMENLPVEAWADAVRQARQSGSE
ncbi:MAG: DUF362 domain-containing protein [Armatimonadetes bacterium]|nr:DUF362 domain-containing protein [Armatimonadota bacterium]